MFVDFARVTGDLDLTPGQFSLLMLLAANPGISQIGLSRAFGLDKSTVSPSIDRLEKRGLVERTRTPNDRRFYALHLTPAGRDLLMRATERVERQEDMMASALTPDERRAMIDMLQRVEAALFAGEAGTDDTPPSCASATCAAPAEPATVSRADTAPDRHRRAPDKRSDRHARARP